jgi:hypothetical protein
LYDTLLEQNLLRIIEPYSVVEIVKVAELVGQDQQAVEAKCVAFCFPSFSVVLLPSRSLILPPIHLFFLSQKERIIASRPLSSCN